MASLYVPPFTDDRGLSLGAAAHASLQEDIPLSQGLASPYLGPPLRIHHPPAGWSLVEQSPAVDAVAGLIAEGEVVAVCRGRDEAGPRALGHRSLLATPTDVALKDRINAEVKRREPFRPFGCVIPMARLSEWFAMTGPSPFMLRIGRALPDRAPLIPGALHHDGTSRVQTVEPADGSGLQPLLEALVRRGHPPVVLNTSLNQRGEPLVHTLAQAAASSEGMGVTWLWTDNGLYKLGVA